MKNATPEKNNLFCGIPYQGSIKKIHIDKYEDKDGKKTNHHYVLASQFYFCENKKPNSDEKEDGDDISFLLD